MTKEERERMFILCEQIAIEKDHATFLKLVKELNDLMERKDKRFPTNPENQDGGSV